MYSPSLTPKSYSYSYLRDYRYTEVGRKEKEKK